MSLLHRFRDHLLTLRLAPGSALVAVSGGPDSVSLLDLLVHTRSEHGLSLVAAHLDHGITPRSAEAVALVRRLAETYPVPLEEGRLMLGADASETEARERRYEWLEATRARLGLDYILTAHHADDQAETVLMRVLAGSGPAGLAGMSTMRGRLVRPLLPFRRGELLTYLRERGLEAWVDPANSDTRHQRSWIRTELLPMVRARVPKVDSDLLRLAAQAARDRSAWDSVVDLLPGLDPRSEDGAVSIAARPIAEYDSNLREAIIRALARRAGCTLGPTRIRRVLELLAAETSGVSVPLGAGWTAESAFGRLRIYRSPSGPAAMPWQVQGTRGNRVWGEWRFCWEVAAAPGRQERTGFSAWFALDSAPLTIRAWAPGERLKPLGGVGRRLVVRCFQEGKVPRSRRATWPVLSEQGELVWIPGVCRSDLRLPEAGSQALRVDAEHA